MASCKGKQIEQGNQFLKTLKADLSKSPSQLTINTLCLPNVLDTFGLTEDLNSEQVWDLSNEKLLENLESLCK